MTGAIWVRPPDFPNSGGRPLKAASCSATSDAMPLGPMDYSHGVVPTPRAASVDLVKERNTSVEGVIICPLRETEVDPPYTARRGYRRFTISPTLAKSLRFTAISAHRSRSASTTLKGRLRAGLCSERTRLAAGERNPITQKTGCCAFDHYRSTADEDKIR